MSTAEAGTAPATAHDAVRVDASRANAAPVDADRGVDAHHGQASVTATGAAPAHVAREGDAGKDDAPLDAFDAAALEAALDADGCAIIPRLLAPADCRALAALYPDDTRFRSRVVMARHGFGRGEYRYFAYPLPGPIAALRETLYPRLAPIANRWYEAMGLAPRFPPRHADFIARCHAAGQTRPTPLLLQYGAGDFNCLHQDLYGEHVFPLQVVLLLSEPGRDFDGGELVMTEQRPRAQSRVQVLPLRQGDAAVIAVHQRPVPGARGFYRVQHRHGVSRLRSGQRHSAGIIFHDAA